MSGNEAFRLGDWRVEPAANLLSRGDREVRVELKVMEVLLCLAKHPDEVVSKRDLIDAVWQTEFIAENTLTHSIAELRQALGDNAKNPVYIRTIPKRGYRLLAKVEWERPQLSTCGRSIEAATPPAFLTDESLEDPERPVFVARETELDRLDTLLEATLNGAGSVAFVTGEAGTGKTALVREFCRRAQERHTDLVVATGACNAATGTGDPYGPWRQALTQLSGDVEGRVARGALSIEAGRRLWEGLPIFAEAIVGSGRDLVATLIPVRGLASRAAMAVDGAPWLDDLTVLATRKETEPPDPTLQQGAVILQVGRVLRQVAAANPLVLVMDDLQWSDTASIALLCDLGRQLEGSRLLIVGAYRPEDVAVGRDGETHPMAPALAELQRVHGEVIVAVGASGERKFIDSLVDTEPNRLDENFREELFGHTRGQALFTVELLRTLQDRGLLVRDDRGRWVVTKDLDWSALPARVEGVVGARIDRLAADLKELLTIASVEGADFTAEVLARISDAGARDTIRLLSRELEKRHRLVSSRGVRAVAEGRISLFGFSHVLFQRYIYNSLNRVERAQLHEDVGTVLEALYGEDCDEIAIQLARHFEEAGLIDRAIRYLLRAGRLAVQTTANVEAVGHFHRALELLGTLQESPERDRWELLIQLALHPPLIATRGWGAEAVGQAAARALELSDLVADPELVGPALWCLAIYHSCRAEYRRGSHLGKRMLELAEARDDEVQAAMAKWTLGVQSYCQGDFETARMLLEEVVAWYDIERHGGLRFVYGIDPGVACLGNLSAVLLSLGYPDAALSRIEETEKLAARLDHPVSDSFAPWFRLLYYAKMRDFTVLRRETDRLLEIATTHHFPVQFLHAKFFDALLRAVESGAPGKEPETMGLMDDVANTSYWTHGSGLFHCAALEHTILGRVPEALAIYDTTLEFIASHRERLYESVILTAKGELLVAVGELEAAETCFVRALEVAGGQHTRLWELFAATALARLWQSQGKITEARELLQPIYDWFTEGLDTVPLQEAKALLDKLTDQNE